MGYVIHQNLRSMEEKKTAFGFTGDDTTHGCYFYFYGLNYIFKCMSLFFKQPQALGCLVLFFPSWINSTENRAYLFPPSQTSKLRWQMRSL